MLHPNFSFNNSCLSSSVLFTKNADLKTSSDLEKY